VATGSTLEEAQTKIASTSIKLVQYLKSLGLVVNKNITEAVKAKIYEDPWNPF